MALRYHLKYMESKFNPYLHGGASPDYMLINQNIRGDVEHYFFFRLE